MKSYFYICLFLLNLMICTKAFGVWTGGCKTDEDCEDTGCCVKPFGGFMGQCLKRPEEGEHCIPVKKYNQMFQAASCPCVDGLECSTGDKDKGPGKKYSSQPKCRPVTDVTESESIES